MSPFLRIEIFYIKLRDYMIVYCSGSELDSSYAARHGRLKYLHENNPLY